MKPNSVKTHLYDESKVKDSIAEMKRAKAIKASQGEIDDIITGKLAERVKLQEGFKSSYYLRVLIQERLKDMKDRIEDAEKHKSHVVDWMGFQYSVEHLRASYNKELFVDYAQAISNENYLRQALVKVGFDEKQLLAIVFKHELVKDHKQLQRMEKEYDNKNIK